MHFVRDANAAGLSDGLQPGCDIDAVPVEALTFVDDISNVYADPEEHRRPGVRVQFRHAALDFGGALHCADSARELGENAVPSDIDHASAKPRYQRNNRLPNFSEILRTVSSSSAPMRALYPAMSADKMAANLRLERVCPGPP